jgi:hypothetical protein
MSKHKQRAHGAQPPTKPTGGMALAAGWPVYEVLLSRGWEQEAALITILVARRSPNRARWPRGCSWSTWPA